MSRTERLLTLMQILRRHRYPISGQSLASELKISLRTLYRDIATLQSQGAQIEGEPGLGYILKPGFTLPPLMFSEEELEALVLGFRFVAKKGDGDLQFAAKNALSKISSVLPNELRHQLDISGLMVGPGEIIAGSDDMLSLIRQAIRIEHPLQIKYCRLDNQQSERIIWPIAMGFHDNVRTLAAWCQLREDFRHFRVDRILSFQMLEKRYPKQRAVLLKQWRDKFNIPPQ